MPYIFDINTTPTLEVAQIMGRKKKEVVIGETIHMLTAAEDVTCDDNNTTMVEAWCDCGNTVSFPYSQFKRGTRYSCGCTRRPTIKSSEFA